MMMLPQGMAVQLAFNTEGHPAKQREKAKEERRLLMELKTNRMLSSD
jgi:hypothetical protein